MSLATTPRQRAQPVRRDTRACPQAPAEPADPPEQGARDAPTRRPRRLQSAHDRHHLADRRGSGGHAAAIDRICRQARDAIAEGVNIIILSDRLVRPEARCRCPRCSPSRPSTTTWSAGHAPAGRDHRRVRRAEGGAPLRDPHRFGASAINPYLMLETLDELVSKGASRAPAPTGRSHGCGAEDAAPERRQSARQRPAEDDLQDGDIDHPVLQGRSDLRGRRAGARSSIDTHFTYTASRIGGVGSGRAGHRGPAAPRPRISRSSRRPAPRRRCLRMAARRRAPHVEPGDDRARPACGAGADSRCRRGDRRRRRRPRRRPRQPRLREVPRVRLPGQRPCARVPRRCAGCCRSPPRRRSYTARGGGARQRDR